MARHASPSTGYSLTKCSIVAGDLFVSTAEHASAVDGSALAGSRHKLKPASTELASKANLNCVFISMTSWLQEHCGIFMRELGERPADGGQNSVFAGHGPVSKAKAFRGPNGRFSRLAYPAGRRLPRSRPAAVGRVSGGSKVRLSTSAFQSWCLDINRSVAASVIPLLPRVMPVGPYLRHLTRHGP